MKESKKDALPENNWIGRDDLGKVNGVVLLKS
jgi:hypothetical protein